MMIRRVLPAYALTEMVEIKANNKHSIGKGRMHEDARRRKKDPSSVLRPILSSADAVNMYPFQQQNTGQGVSNFQIYPALPLIGKYF